jgi:hypothetical protein
MLCLWLSLSLYSLDADTAVFGLMGEDLLQFGRPPILTYGQTYLVSLTPYTYALARVILPALTPAKAFVLGGAVLSLSGLWLVYEALITTVRRQSQRVLPAAAVFCLLIAASPRFILDLGRNSSNEISLFLVGLFFFAATRLEAIEEGSGQSGLGWLLLLGCASGYALCSRPNTLPYALALGVPLAVRRPTWLRGLAPRLLVLSTLGIGFCLGYLPMVLHRLARGPSWPFVYGFAPRLASPGELCAAARVVVSEVVPAILQLDRGDLLLCVVISVWTAVSLVALSLALLRRWRHLSVADLAWPAGTLLVLILMLVIPGLALNAECRRYALPAYLAVVWTFCRFCLPRSPMKWAAVALAVTLAGASCPLWGEWLARARRENDARRLIASEVVPLLERSGAAVLADYSDAYLLRFISGGQLKIEAFPWQIVRTYGFLRAGDFDGRLVLFLSRSNTRHMRRRGPVLRRLRAAPA